MFSNGRKLVSGLAIVVVVGGSIWAFWPSTTSPGQLLRENGFLEIVPPARYYGPGTINTVEIRSDGRLQLHPTCNIDDDLLDSHVLESPTTARNLVQHLSKRFDVSARINELLSAKAEANKAKSAYVSFDDVSILLISDESLLNLRNELLKESCEAAVVWNIRNDGIVCQTKAVIKADVVYQLTFEDSLSINERADITSEVMSELDVDIAAARGGADQIVGEALYLGVRLAPRGITLNSSAPSEVDCRSLLEPAV